MIDSYHARNNPETCHVTRKSIPEGLEGANPSFMRSGPLDWCCIGIREGAKETPTPSHFTPSLLHSWKFNRQKKIGISWSYWSISHGTALSLSLTSSLTAPPASSPIAPTMFTDVLHVTIDCSDESTTFSNVHRQVHDALRCSLTSPRRSLTFSNKSTFSDVVAEVDLHGGFRWSHKAALCGGAWVQGPRQGGGGGQSWRGQERAGRRRALHIAGG